MKKLITTILLGLALFAVNANADQAKGQKFYLKTLKAKFGYNGTKFAAEHTQDEWKELFANNGEGFIKEFSEKFPKAEPILKSETFQKNLEDLKDFAVEYASDSGNVPSCG